jgi:hypothetical protein
MNFYEESVHEVIRSYSLLYVYIGEIELTLRKRIPELFSVAGTENNMKDWIDFLDFDLISRNALTKAKKFSSNQEVTTLLPLSFWTRLFSRANYEKFWLHHLFKLFPNLRNAKSRKSFHEINNLIFSLRIIRNHVAHYNFSNFERLSADRKNLRRLMFLLGLKVN